MLGVSKRINPECEHLQGDMRTVRLGRVFDAVLVHDAVCYMRTLADLHAAFATAFVHCRPGGAALFAPDHIRENFVPMTDHGGHDGAGRSLRYLEWTTDPNPHDDTYTTDYACMLHESGKPTRAVLDTHVCGLFSAAQWEQGLGAAGFDPVTRTAGPMDPGYDYTIFIAVRTR